MCGWAINTFLDCFLCLSFSLGWCRLWYPNRVQLKSIWNVAWTFSTFHGCDKATGHGRLLWDLEADTWFEYGGDACFLQQAKQMSLEMNTLRSVFGWLSYHVRTRNDTCKLWLKRAGCLLQTLLHFHFKWEVLCTINQRGILREAVHYHFPRPLKSGNVGAPSLFYSHGIIHQGA